MTNRYLIVFFSLLCINCIKHELIKEYKEEIIRNCNKLTNPWKIAKKLEIKKTTKYTKYPIFKMYDTGSADSNSSALIMYKATLSSGYGDDIIKAAYYIITLSRDAYISKYFQSYEECYYYEGKDSINGDELKNIYFTSKQDKLGDIEHLSDLEYTVWPFNRKLKVFMQIIELFKQLTKHNLRWYKIAVEDIKLDNYDHIVLPFYKLGTFTDIEVPCFNQPKRSFIDKFISKSQYSDIWLNNLFNTSEEMKYIAAEITTGNNQIDINMLERSDVYNLGLIFVQLFGLYNDKTYSDFIKKCLIDGRIEDWNSDSCKNVINTMIGNNVFEDEIEHQLMRYIIGYYLNHLFNYDVESTFYTILLGTDLDIIIKSHKVDYLNCKENYSLLNAEPIMTKIYDNSYNKYVKEETIYIFKGYIGIVETPNTKFHSEPYHDYMYKLQRIQEIKTKVNYIEKRANAINQADYIIKLTDKCHFIQNNMFLETENFNLILSQLFIEKYNLLFDLSDLLSIAHEYIYTMHKIQGPWFLLLNINPNEIFLASDSLDKPLSPYADFTVKILPWKYEQIGAMNAKLENIRKVLCDSSNNNETHMELKLINDFCENNKFNIKLLKKFEVYKFGLLFAKLLVPGQQESIHEKINLIDIRYAHYSLSLRKNLAALIENCLKEDTDKRYSIEDTKHKLEEIIIHKKGEENGFVNI